MSTIQGMLRIAEKLAPVLKNSKFKETGVLTPEEVRCDGGGRKEMYARRRLMRSDCVWQFVAAGDFLVFKCPTWEWCAPHFADDKAGIA